MTKKENSGKEKNIDDVLLSIDSLLDTASDVEPRFDTQTPDALKSEPALETKKPTTPRKPKQAATRTRPTPKKKTTVKKKPSGTDKPVPNTALKKAELTEDKTAINDSDQHSANKRSASVRHESSDVMHKKDNPAPALTPDVLEKLPATDDVDNTLSADQSTDPQQQKPENNDSDDQQDNSLNFTTVDDDLSQAMRELPVLDDIVTGEDLALIGSGKEPPKKILTETFKKKTTTDKVIDVLENHLSDYNISKLEYEYLHQLIDELLSKSNSRS